MPMVFPTSPTVGQVFSSGGRSWVWTGTTWDSPSSATAALSGLTLVKSQTIGTAVTSVTVTDAFSATYDAYKIIVSGGSAPIDNALLRLALGSASTGHNWNLLYNAWGGSGVSTLSGLNQAFFVYVGSANTTSLSLDVTLIDPFAARPTLGTGYYSDNINGATTQLRHTGLTSFTAFTISSNAATITGGTISVYGYRKA